MGVFSVLSAVAVQAAAASMTEVSGLRAGDLAGRMQQLSLSQLEALYSLLDDDGSGDVRHLLPRLKLLLPPSPHTPHKFCCCVLTPVHVLQLTVHEMIDLFDGIDNDALLLDDCNGNPAPHHWLGDGYCDDGTDVEDGGLDCAIASSHPSLSFCVASKLTRRPAILPIFLQSTATFSSATTVTVAPTVVSCSGVTRLRLRPIWGLFTGTLTTPTAKALKLTLMKVLRTTSGPRSART